MSDDYCPACQRAYPLKLTAKGNLPFHTKLMYVPARMGSSWVKERCRGSGKKPSEVDRR